MEYTNYELYQILDENGYEPSDENLQILKEGLESGDIILEGEQHDLRVLKSKKASKEDVARAGERLKNREKRPEGFSLANSDVLKKSLALKHTRHDNINDKDSWHVAKGKTHGNHDELSKAINDTVKAENRRGKDAVPLKESSYLDYELYKLLEENNFETSRENLQILKDGLLSGDIELSE